MTSQVFNLRCRYIVRNMSLLTFRRALYPFLQEQPQVYLATTSWLARIYDKGANTIIDISKVCKFIQTIRVSVKD